MRDSKWPFVALFAVVCTFAAVLARGWPANSGVLDLLSTGGTVAAAIVAAVAAKVALEQGAKAERWKLEQELRELTIIRHIVLKDAELAYNGLAALQREVEAWGPDHPASTPDQRLAVLQRVEDQLAFTACWKMLDKLAWLPAEAGRDISKLLAQVPAVVAAFRRTIAWDGSIALLTQTLEALDQDLSELISSANRVCVALRPSQASAERATD